MSKKDLLKNLSEQGADAIDLGTLYREDENGQEIAETVTDKDFFNLINLCTQGTADADQKTLLQTIIKTILSQYDNENETDETLLKTLDALKVLSEFLSVSDYQGTVEHAQASFDFDKTFNTIRQSVTTNKFTKIRPTKNNTVIDELGTATIQQGNFTVSITNYEQLAGLNTTALQLFDAFTIIFTETGAKSTTIKTSLTEYMERRGLKDRKEARKQVVAALDVLRQTSITCEERRGNDTVDYSFVNIADSGRLKKNGEIEFTFGQKFYQILINSPVMPYPALLQKLNSKRNPNSFYLLRRISEHKNMNFGKPNEDIISVKTLLKAAPYLPSYEEVKKNGGSYQQKIITPFARDMDALKDTVMWHYCDVNGAPLPENELVITSYRQFEESRVLLTWIDYPEHIQQEKLKRKAAAIEEAKKTTGKRKKTTKTQTKKGGNKSGNI